MPKDTKSSGYNKAPACESRGFGHKKEGENFDTPSTLYRKIKQYSDLSILELTRNIRLKKAAELLASQQYSVQEVAEMVGFNDTATFRKRFTEQYGVTPSQYGIPA